jgi:hypothetical protein
VLIVEAYIPLLCLVAITALLWFSVLRQRSGNGPLVWTWRTVGVATLGALGAVAIPILVAVILNS